MPQAFRGKAILPQSLAALAALGGDGGDVGLGPGGGMFATMRPGLRNALSDAAGEQALSDLEDRQPTVFHRPGSSVLPGFLGQPMDEVYDPDTDAPIAAAERDRQRAARGVDYDNSLHDVYDPLEAQREQRLKDIGAAGDLSRYWEPSEQARQTQEFGRKYDLTTDPARIAAGNRLDVANVAGGAKVEAAQAGRAMPNFAQLFKSIADTYPKDPRTGEAQLPPQIQTLRDALANFAGQGVNPPPAPAPAVPSGPPLTPGQMQILTSKLLDEGYSADEIRAYLRQRNGGG